MAKKSEQKKQMLLREFKLSQLSAYRSPMEQIKELLTPEAIEESEALEKLDKRNKAKKINNCILIAINS